MSLFAMSLSNMAVLIFQIIRWSSDLNLSLNLTLYNFGVNENDVKQQSILFANQIAEIYDPLVEGITPKTEY